VESKCSLPYLQKPAAGIHPESNKSCPQLDTSLGAFAKLRKGTLSFAVYVCPSVCPSVRPHGITRLTLNFRNRASYIQDGRTATLQILHFIYFFSTTISTEYFKHAAHSPFFSSKCLLFHNLTFFGSCIIHILHTGCAKI